MSHVNGQRSQWYITTTTPYVNSAPHIGFAKEIIFADSIARYHALIGDTVAFNTGADEHGKKIFEAAQAGGMEPQEYVDSMAPVFKGLKEQLNLSFTHFTRTTDPHHVAAAQEFWRRCDKAGYIYKKNYQVKYCVGCELEKQDHELEDGHCTTHPHLEIENIDEENYFFKFSEFQKPLLYFYEKNSEFVVPFFRFNEIKAFVERGLQDFSISRLKSKMPWGVPVPGDDEHVFYVWFDALVNYISALGWPCLDEAEGGGGPECDFRVYWPGVQVAGKDNLRQQSAMWQAMLMAAGLPHSKQIVILGFITGSGGVKMSKSLGNVIAPQEIINEYGTDALRYYVLREITPFEDGEFTHERFLETYNANLANGIGNMVSRIVQMSEKHLESVPLPEESEIKIEEELGEHMRNYEVNKAMDIIWAKMAELDEHIGQVEPFKLIKTDPEKAKESIRYLMASVFEIGVLLRPFLPETAEKILAAVRANKKPEPIFLRK